MLSSVLVANRGEIAVRIIATLRRLGIRAIAVYSDADASAPHVRLADTAIAIGPAPARDSYLRADAIVEAALRTGAQAVHPGYGFLSEQADFARACAHAGVVFVGPPPEAMQLLGDKVAAKTLAASVAVAVVPGIERPDLGDDEIIAWAGAQADRFPLIVKAAAGGGGRGMRVVHTLDELAPALVTARREALAGFGDGRLLAERYIQPARHIEVQVLADRHGAAIHVGERECSLQRRHQKLVEECPSPGICDELRERMGAAAVAIALAAGYQGAGTCEFLVPAAGAARDFYFLEVNARLQVEHPVTELVYGLDLVEAQLRLAAGEPLWLAQDDVAAGGHAIEARVCAERAERGFLPGAGRIVAYREPTGPGIRVDSGVQCGSEVSSHYDSLLAKVVAHAPTREQALERLDGALAHLAILGPPTTTAFLRRLLADPRVHAGDLDTGLVERLPADTPAHDHADDDAVIVAALARTLARPRGDDPWESLSGWRIDGCAPLRWHLAPEGADGPGSEVRVAGDRVRVDDGPGRIACAQLRGDELICTLDNEQRTWIHARDGDVTRLGIDGRAWGFHEQVVELRPDLVDAGAALTAPMPGSVLDVRVRDGDAVRAGDVLVVLESMKMELEVVASSAGTVHGVRVRTGDRVSGGQTLVEIA